MSDKQISRRNLALWLAWPAIRGEFGPTHPFVGGPSMTMESPWPKADSKVLDLRSDFLDSLRRAVSQHESVAVATSGGLDSLAVLANLIHECGHERRIVAVAIEMIDDLGQSNIPVVHRLVDGLGLTCDIRVRSLADRPTGQPQWHPEGPRLDALPSANRMLVEAAHDAGAQVLLTGDGADELLLSPQYMTPALVLAGRWGALRKYWRDHRGEYYPTAELERLALRSIVVSSRRRAMLFMAGSHPELCRRPPHDFLNEPYRQLVDEWTTQWVRSLLRLHEDHHPTLSEMDAWSALYPHQRLRTAGLIGNEDPFLDEVFVEAAKRLPVHRRYDERYPHAYWRMKAQVIKLMPPGALPFLPTAKQIYRRAIVSRVDARTWSADCLMSSGILSERALCGDLDPMAATRVLEIETWLAEALDMGYELVDE
ncbi:MAG: asparagine synthase-related protein [Pseudonocardiaceae bacterium]